MVSLDFFAMAPEVHSTLLSSGPGPGGLLAAAEAWHGLQLHYVDAANELRVTITDLVASSWQGCSADNFAASHQPYLSWLDAAALHAAAAAQSHTEVAAAYVMALAEMPTLPELAFNHSAHAVLVGTNFFGLNTIPIALNEADYARMWVQAATAMSTYDAISSVVVGNVPPTPPVPRILAGGVGASDSGRRSAMVEAANARVALGRSQSIVDRLIDIIRFLNPPLGDALLEFATLDLRTLLTLLATNPSAAAALLGSLPSSLLGYAIFQAIGFIFWGSVLGPFLLLAPAIALPIAIGFLEQQQPRPPHAAAEPNREDPAASSPHTRSEPSVALSPNPPLPQTPSTPSPSSPAGVSTAPSTPAVPSLSVYAIGSGSDPERDPGPRVNDSRNAAEEAVLSTSASVGAAGSSESLARRRARRGRRPAVTDDADKYEKMSASATAPASTAGTIPSPSLGGGAASLPSTVRARNLQPRGLIAQTMQEQIIAPIQVTIPRTWAAEEQYSDPHGHHQHGDD